MVRPLIACVKQGIKYGPDYVRRLRDGVARNLSVPHDFVCLTEDPVPGVETVPLSRTWPGWWSKLSLCDLGRPLIYFDLDVVITGDLLPLIGITEFTMMADPWQRTFNSSVMVLTGREGDISATFRPEMIDRLRGGDQTWWTMCRPNARTLPVEWFPSFKANARLQHVPAGTLGVVFHGSPAPHEVDLDWVDAHWRGHVRQAA